MKITFSRKGIIILSAFFAVTALISIYILSIPEEPEPTLDSRLAIAIVENYYLDRGIDLDRISRNYVDVISPDEPTVFTYVYRQLYVGDRFRIQIYYSPANISFSECYIKDNEVLGCENTIEADEFIQKYS